MMAVSNIIRLHEITNRLRVEAEFYRPEYVKCHEAIKGIPHSPLRVLIHKITDGTHFTPRYAESGVPFYSAVNVKQGYFVLVAARQKAILPARWFVAALGRCRPVRVDDRFRTGC